MQKYIFILAPTRYGFRYLKTMLVIRRAIELAGKIPFQISMTCDKGFCQSRNQVMRELHFALIGLKIKTDSVRAFWLDDDIEIDKSFEPWRLAKAILVADYKGLNLIGNYKNEFGKNLLKTTDAVNLSDNEIAGFQDFQELPGIIGGLGFYYGDVPVNYSFNLSRVDDWQFYLDSFIKLNFLNIPLLHNKKKINNK
jgi:hypothetical protein